MLSWTVWYKIGRPTVELRKGVRWGREWCFLKLWNNTFGDRCLCKWKRQNWNIKKMNKQNMDSKYRWYFRHERYHRCLSKNTYLALTTTQVKCQRRINCTYDWYLQQKKCRVGTTLLWGDTDLQPSLTFLGQRLWSTFGPILWYLRILY